MSFTETFQTWQTWFKLGARQTERGHRSVIKAFSMESITIYWASEMKSLCEDYVNSVTHNTPFLKHNSFLDKENAFLLVANTYFCSFPRYKMASHSCQQPSQPRQQRGRGNRGRGGGRGRGRGRGVFKRTTTSNYHHYSRPTTTPLSDSTNNRDRASLASLSTLELPPSATETDIKAAFKSLAMKWHPDKWTREPPFNKKFAEGRFKEISAAYQQLKSIL